jgi:hypothetical protein
MPTSHKWCQNSSTFFYIYCLRSRKCLSSISRPFITNHKPIILYFIFTLWNNMGNLLLWVFIYPLTLQIFSADHNKRLMYPYIISLYVMNTPVHDFCHGGCELHVCFVDAVHPCLLLVILLRAMESVLWKLFACL